jgi:hypothetical protein
MMMKNKKADERLLSIYLFIIYLIVSIGIVSGVLLFHGSGLDVRIVEAGILNDKIIDCLVSEGILNEEILNESSDLNIEEFCNIKLKDYSSSYEGEEQSGVKIRLFDFDLCSKNDQEVNCLAAERIIEIGRKDFFAYCGLEGDKIPKCSEKWVYVLTKDNEKLMLNVLGAVRKVEKNV